MNCLMDKKYVTAAVSRIYWERVILHLEVEVHDHRSFQQKNIFEFYLINEDYKVVAKFRKEETSPGLYHCWMNITNPGNCRCLPMGNYRLFVFENDYVMAKCMLMPRLVPQIENASRSFLHDNRGKAYSVNFFVSEGEEGLPLLMHTLEAARMPLEQESNWQIIKSIVRDPLVKLKKNMGRMFWKIVYFQYTLRYRNKEHVLMFMTEQSETLGGNLEAVLKRLRERGMEGQYKILTSARPASYVPQTKRSNWKLVKKMAKSKFIFLDDHAPILDWLKMEPTTKVIQLWHAGAGFKSSGYSRWGHLGCPSPISCHRQYYYGISGSRHISKFFAEVFGINDAQILPTGMPRMDEYLDPEYQREKREKLYQEYPVCKGKKVILFAPTYRGKGRQDAYYPYEKIDFDGLHDLCRAEGYVVLFKMHPWVRDPVPISDRHKDIFVDVGRYPNINDLFYITEVLITDYSSNIFEFSLMKKPMLFFAFDRIQYSFSRGFHRDYEEAAPGKVCYDFVDILQSLEDKDFEFEKVQRYVDLHFDHIDSKASDRVIDWIILGNVPLDILREKVEWENLYRKMRRMKMSSLRRLEEKADER